MVGMRALGFVTFLLAISHNHLWQKKAARV